MSSRALKTFEAAIERAEYLEQLYHSFINTRQRGIRADWRREFNRIMHWNPNKEIQRVDTKDAIIILKEESSIDPQVFAAAQLSDLLRASLTMAVSAMDAYYHAKIADNLGKVLRKSPKNYPEKLSNMKMTVLDLITAYKTTSPRQGVSKAVARVLYYHPLQTTSDISNELKLIGAEDFWGKVSHELGMREKTVKNRLKEITNRRNRIVHEGDLSRSKKAGNLSRVIEPGFTRDSTDFIKELVEASEVVIDRCLSPRAGSGP